MMTSQRTFRAQLLAALLLPAACRSGGDALPKVLVFEDAGYVDRLVEGPAGRHVSLAHCGPPSYCEGSLSDPSVLAVVGQPNNVSILGGLRGLKLMQSTSYMYTRLAEVPSTAAVASYQCDWRGVYGLEPMAEFMIAAVFEWNYRLGAHNAAFAGCAWGSDAPSSCPTHQRLTAHRVLMNQTLGVLGYGGIGQAVARRAAALGMRVVATKHHPPFSPTPPGIAWLSGDNDRLLRESDIVIVTVPGEVKGIINKTSLGLMKPDAVVVPISAQPVDYDALYAALVDRAIGGAVLDVWPHGCWHFPEMECGPPFGPDSQPATHNFSQLDNAMVLPGMAMRDDKFWMNSAVFVSENLANLAQGLPLRGVVRNASSPKAAVRDILA